MRPPTIDIVNGCNFSCRHCSAAGPSSSHIFLNKDVFARIIKELGTMGFRYAELAGTGEVTLHPQLEDIFLILARNNFTFEVLTNGYLFKEKILPLIKGSSTKKHLHRIGFSLDSSKERVHDYIRKRESFRKIIEAIGLCRLHGIPFYIKTVVTNLNKNHLKEFILFTSSLRASFHSFILPVPAMQMLEEKIMPEPPELYSIFKELLYWKKIFPVVNVEGFTAANKIFSCNAFDKFGMDERGNYLVCSNLGNVETREAVKNRREILGNIKHSGLSALIKRHLNLLPEIVRWRLARKDIIQNEPFSLCYWCFFQFGKLNWLKKYPGSLWARCVALKSIT